MFYELYENVIKAYHENNNELFIAAARNWIEGTSENPFENREAHEYFFNANKSYRAWIRGGIDSRSAKVRMISNIRKIAEMGLPNPYDKNEKPKKIKKSIEIKMPEKDVTKEEQTEDMRVVMMAMAKAYNENDEVSFQQFTVHLMDIATENPFKQGSDEYNMFEEMYASYYRKPTNKRRLFVIAAQLCNLINNTPVERPQTVLGVLPEEKKNWFKFLHPWRKDDSSDSP